MSNTTTPARSPMPNSAADALAHLTTDHGWDEQPADSSLIQAHRFAHGIDGRPDLADTDLAHGHGGWSAPTQAQAFASPQPYPYVPVQRRTNGLAIASLVLGITWLWWVGSLLAIIFGVIALRQINGSNEMQTGRGLAIAGVVLGWVGFATFAFFGIVMLIGAASSSTSGY